MVSKATSQRKALEATKGRDDHFPFTLCSQGPTRWKVGSAIMPPILLSNAQVCFNFFWFTKPRSGYLKIFGLLKVLHTNVCGPYAYGNISGFGFDSSGEFVLSAGQYSPAEVSFMIHYVEAGSPARCVFLPRKNLEKNCAIIESALNILNAARSMVAHSAKSVRMMMMMHFAFSGTL